MLDIRRIDDSIAVSPQIDPADIAAIKAAGFVAIVNNRPDGEEPGQPGGDAVRAAAEDAGLGYSAIPITHAGFGHAQVSAMIDALAQANGPVLAYCRSGHAIVQPVGAGARRAGRRCRCAGRESGRGRL